MNWFGRALGVVFGLIGITVIVSLWTEDGFGEPPVFFKIFGSLVAMPFIFIGVASVLGRGIGTPAVPGSNPVRATPPTNLTCTNCGATIEDGSEVSPSGDVKCTYCQTWFNVHQRT